MPYTVCTTLQADALEMRTAYADTMISLAETNDKIIAMDADLMNSVGMVKFAKAYPKQTINCGIQEANMVGVAAGLSATGFVPFAHTFACFASRRVADQVFISGAYAGANIRIIGSDPGITAAYNGGTHMPFEDIGIMRLIPTLTVIEPTDATMLCNITRQLANAKGVYYVRLSRKKATRIYEEGSTFEIGKAATLRGGRDVTLIASGICVAESLKAADMLAEKGVSARVLDMFTIKPVDRDTIEKAARETGAIVTAENHNVIGGLGSAVAEAMAETCPVPMERVGVADHFGEVGPVDYLREKFHLTANDIVDKALRAIERKKTIRERAT